MPEKKKGVFILDNKSFIIISCLACKIKIDLIERQRKKDGEASFQWATEMFI